ncbi:MAG: DUF1646 domain-containing protein [Firmicutes bacterium]|nr:DUF1646 domain-containing protein [Bacillota bacterium]
MGLLGAFSVKGSRSPEVGVAGEPPALGENSPGPASVEAPGEEVSKGDAAAAELPIPAVQQTAMKETGEEEESYKDVAFRAVKIFVFVMALELLGAGFKPVIDSYVIYFDSRLLYWVNMVSAVLDNATLAAAEISDKMTSAQIQAILMGLLISGGMLIPGNIPNIVSAGKLKIGSREWARLGVPLGLVLMVIYFIVLFVVL